MPTGFHTFGALIAGGIRISSLQHIVGLLAGDVANTARDEGRIQVPEEVLSSWSTEQAKLIGDERAGKKFKALCAEIILGLNGSVFDLPIAYWGGKWLNSKQLRKRFLGENEIVIQLGEVSYDDDFDFMSKYEFKDSFKLHDEIVLIPETLGRLSETRGRGSQLKRVVLSELAEAWGNYSEADEERTVGTVGHENITRSVAVFERVDD
jgi:hypothetical protein